MFLILKRNMKIQFSSEKYGKKCEKFVVIYGCHKNTKK